MAESLQVLCLSPDATIGDGVAAMLASLPRFTVATRIAGYADGLRELRDPDIVIVVLPDDPTPGLAVIESVRRGARGTYLVAVSLDDDPDTLVRTVRAGADEHLALPLSQQDLLKVCVKVVELWRGGSGKSARGSELWVAYSPKGGVGVTTIAVNVAVALRAAQRSVALVDLDVYGGEVACFLNLTPTYTLRDVAGVERLDASFLQGMMIRHTSGVQVLAAPGLKGREARRELSTAQATAVLELMSGLYDVTVVDTPGIPSDAVVVTLLAATRILLVTDLTVPALRGCAQTIEWLREEGVDTASTIDVVVNKHSNRTTEISTAEASRTLGLALRVLLPRDDAAAAAAANSGRPLSEVAAGSALERAIAAIAGGPAPVAETGRRLPSLRRLFSTGVRA
ncbi:MAG TPA: P-loop NTPase [Candidatus Binatia bacterium]|nr:P-loop NTPase [Candidatus Binatia bacterium]